MKRIGCLLLVLLLVGCGKEAMQETTHNTAPLENPRLVVLLTDQHAAPLNAKKLYLSISQISIHEEQGWQILTQNAKRYDLADIRKKNRNQLVMNISLQPGKYDQLKLQLSRGSLTQKWDEEKLYLAGNELPLPLELELKMGGVYVIVINIDTAKSLYETLDDHYVLAPQIRLETRQNPTIQENYELSGGSITRTELGMDESGHVEERLHMHPETKLRIVNEKVKASKTISNEAAVNVYLTSQGNHSPLQLVLKEARLISQEEGYLSIYEGSQEVLLNENQIQRIASAYVPTDSYTKIKLYFQDQGLANQNTLIEVPASITGIYRETLQPDQTLNLLLLLETSVEKTNVKITTPFKALSEIESGIRADASKIGQRAYLPETSLEKIKEAEKEEKFR